MGGSPEHDQGAGPRVSGCWQVVVMDLDPEAGCYGGSTEVKVKIAATPDPTGSLVSNRSRFLR